MPFTFSWYPLTSITGANTLEPIVNPLHDTTYILSVQSGVGCGIASDGVFIKVYKKVYVPNAFSPNKDGINDQWRLQAIEAYPDAEVNIFNRYGQAVFTSIGYALPWDGTSKGKPVPVGTYYYIINLKPSTQQLKGWVEVLR